MSQSSAVAPSRISVFLAYLAGVAYWVIYFVKGKPTFTGNDWIREQVFSNVVRESFQSWQLPWRISEPFYHGVFEMIANPEISLTPDVLLLNVLSNNAYFLVHWLIFFTIGFAGTVLLAKKYAVGSLPFVFFVVLFNFNGFISSHLSEGHIQWAGYFLFPLLFYWLSDFSAEIEVDRTRAALKIALLLGLMFMNGSFHTAIWCLMLMGLTLIYRRDLWRPVGLVLLLVGLIGVARLLPAAMYFPPKVDFQSGYPTISTLFAAFTYVYHPENPTRGGLFANLAWHEYSFFTGYIGLVFLGVGVYVYIKDKLQSVPMWWIPAALIMFLFAMGDVYQLIPNSGLPFSTIERVPSRFISVPFCLMLLIAAVGFARLEQRHRHYTRLALILSLAPMLGEIFQNARNWRIESYEAAVGVHAIPVVTIVESHDQFLRLVVGAGWSISVATVLFTVAWLIRLRRV